MNAHSEPAVSSLVTQPEAPEAEDRSLIFPFPSSIHRATRTLIAQVRRSLQSMNPKTQIYSLARSRGCGPPHSPGQSQIKFHSERLESCLHVATS